MIQPKGKQLRRFIAMSMFLLALATFLFFYAVTLRDENELLEQDIEMHRATEEALKQSLNNSYE